MTTDADRARIDGPDVDEHRSADGATETPPESRPERSERGLVSTDSHRTDNASNGDPDGGPTQNPTDPARVPAGKNEADYAPAGLSTEFPAARRPSASLRRGGPTPFLP